MGKPFKLSILSDFRDLLRGTKDASEGFDDLADSLDDVAKEGDDSADKLARSFKDALGDVKKETKTTGKAIADDLDDGAKKAGESMAEFKDEAGGAAREAATSFDGSAESITDIFRDVAANAFAGFGPAGAAAGIAVAAGIGLAIAALEQAAEKAAESKDNVITLAQELSEVDGNPRALDWATRLRERLTEVTDNKEWWEFWQSEPQTRLEQWTASAERYGVRMSDITRGLAGDQASLGDVLGNLDRQIAEQEAAMLAAGTATSEYGLAAVDTAAPLRAFRDELVAEGDAARQAAEMNGDLTAAVTGIGDAASDSASITESYRGAVADALTGAGESWEEYTENGKVNLAEYNTAIEEQAKAVEQFEQNLVTASASLSQEALDYVRSLGPEAAPLLKSFVDAPLSEQQRTARNWDVLGRAATDGYKESLALTDATQRALAGAQNTANGLPITFGSQLNSKGLGQAVANLAQTMTNTAPPVILRTMMRQTVI